MTRRSRRKIGKVPKRTQGQNRDKKHEVVSHFALSWQMPSRGPSGDRIARSCRHTGPDLTVRIGVKDRTAKLKFIATLAPLAVR